MKKIIVALLLSIGLSTAAQAQTMCELARDFAYDVMLDRLAGFTQEEELKQLGPNANHPMFISITQEAYKVNLRATKDILNAPYAFARRVEESCLTMWVKK